MISVVPSMVRECVAVGGGAEEEAIGAAGVIESERVAGGADVDGVVPQAGVDGDGAGIFQDIECVGCGAGGDIGIGCDGGIVNGKGGAVIAEEDIQISQAGVDDGNDGEGDGGGIHRAGVGSGATGIIDVEGVGSLADEGEFAEHVAEIAAAGGGGEAAEGGGVGARAGVDGGERAGGGADGVEGISAAAQVESKIGQSGIGNRGEERLHLRGAEVGGGGIGVGGIVDGQ